MQGKVTDISSSLGTYILTVEIEGPKFPSLSLSSRDLDSLETRKIEEASPEYQKKVKAFYTEESTLEKSLHLGKVTLEFLD